MADYGISVVNNSGSVVISNNYKIMVFSERGTFNIRSSHTDTEGTGSVAFMRPILTQEPPQIFVRFVSGAHSDLAIYTTVFGSPGSWTGFQVNSAVRGGSTLQNYTMEYVSCKYADKTDSESFGMNIWDSSGAPIYNSGDRIVRYSKFTKAWSRVQGNMVDTYTSGLSIDVDDFTCVSAFDRGVMWFANGASFAGLTLLASGVRVLNIAVDIISGLYYYQGVNGQSFTIQVCKFPTDRYFN